MSLVTDVRTRLNEVSAVFWPDTQVYDALNEALLEVYARTKFAYVVTTMTVTNSASIVAIPTPIYIPQRVVSTSGEKPITTHARLERHSRGWKNVSRTEPSHFATWDSEHVRAYPASDTTYTYEVTGVNYPAAEISAGNQDITGLPRLIRNALEFLAGAILIQATLPFVADEWFTQAEAHIYDYMRQKRNNQSHNIRRLRPAKKWQIALGGDIDVLGRI